MRFFLVCAAVLVAVAARSNRHHGKPPCGMPKFSEKLATEKKTELEAIWKDFKEGEECDEEREKTKEFVSKLSDEERKGLFGDHHKHHRGPHFLKGVPEEVRDKFQTLFRDHTVDREEKHKRFHEMAMKELTGDKLEEFLKFEKTMEERKAEWNKKVDALSVDARKVYEQLQALREQKRKILAEAKPEIRKELDALFDHHHHRFGRHHGHHSEERRH
ncbi:hypothetical protein PRIPAC_87202 [Pristionchus pacificus]|uniref:Uncharacterized protein n=1 Tax=Pristionchus pacificus TaxID=54126 RepID=A0A454Y5P2_PRIPA|nr:hypothetical protein PRIPAC_87202 [Pristionchus pacificus]|eukprot:PDM83268.1 hypothetical protein PRIPAC_34900 [Pristionchus pacificus]